jgi:hypothetical protein
LKPSIRVNQRYLFMNEIGFPITAIPAIPAIFIPPFPLFLCVSKVFGFRSFEYSQIFPRGVQFLRNASLHPRLHLTVAGQTSGRTFSTVISN